jgi:hypothetical protein
MTCSISVQKSQLTSTIYALVVGIKQIRVSDETWRQLTDLGEFGETYSDIVARVTKHYISCPEVKRKKQKE